MTTSSSRFSPAFTGSRSAVLVSLVFGTVMASSLTVPSAASARVCTLSSRICAATDSTGRCTRYDNTFRCVTESAEKDRCETSVNPTLGACSQTAETCTSTDGELCLEISRNYSCTAEPSGAGVTVKDPIVTFSYSTSREGTLPDGCVIAREVCRDDTPREIPLTNAPHRTVTATPPCWEKELIVSCPSADAASSCQMLEAAGCERLSEAVCEERVAGVCRRWSASYRCTQEEVTGDDITTDGSVTIPGEDVEDTSACDALLQDAVNRGLSCTTTAKTCVTQGPNETTPCLEYETALTCTAPAADGCQGLKALAQSGDCLSSAPAVCSERAEDGTCLSETQAFLCRGSVAESAVTPATLVSTAEVPDHAESDVCAAPDAATMSVYPVSRTQLTSRAAVTDLSGCVKTDSTCTEGPGIRFVNGKPEYRTCWNTTETWTCRSSEEDECSRFENDASCELVSETCTESDTCARPNRVYRCKRPGTTAVIGEVCDGETCIAGVCRPTDGEANSDFANAVVQLEIGRQAGVYGSVETNRFFSGQVSSCKDRSGASSCCRAEAVAGTNNTAFGQLLMFGMRAGIEYIKYVGSPYVYDALAWSDKTSELLSGIYGTNNTGAYSPSFSFWGVTASYTGGAWSFSFSPTGFLAAAAFNFYDRYSSCDAEDQRTGMAKGQRLCHFVGTTCEKRVSGLGCVETSEKHVCFNSRLARIINEQGRPQIGRDFGTPVQPDPRGFTIEELQQLDFSQMDLSEFTADVIKEITANGTISAEEASARAAERIAAMVNAEIARTADVPGAQAVVASPDQPVTPEGTGSSGSASSQPD